MSRRKDPNVRRKEPIDWLKIAKIADPVVQTMIIIVIFVLFDYRGNKYMSFLSRLLKYQIFSLAVNLFLRFPHKLKVERYLAMAAVGLWYAGDRYYNHFRMQGKVSPTFSMILGKGPTVFNVYDSIYVITGISIAIWYFSICFSEARRLVKSRRKLKRN